MKDGIAKLAISCLKIGYYDQNWQISCINFHHVTYF